MRKNQQKSLQEELRKQMRSVTTIPELASTGLTNTEILASSMITKAICDGNPEMTRLIIDVLGDSWLKTG